MEEYRSIWNEELSRHFSAYLTPLPFDSLDAKQKNRPGGRFFCLERMMGVEPTLSAWEAGVLPMNYIRKR